ncbi:hypothetical protein [Kingella potus]|uniref:hypothetical protein n=1 Tax=Kingella potus TaxID=265175 RepID=UPI0011C03D1D|nr:hypothetical protein [Kingella potus]
MDEGGHYLWIICFNFFVSYNCIPYKPVGGSGFYLAYILDVFQTAGFFCGQFVLFHRPSENLSATVSPAGLPFSRIMRRCFRQTTRINHAAENSG